MHDQEPRDQNATTHVWPELTRKRSLPKMPLTPPRSAVWSAGRLTDLLTNAAARGRQSGTRAMVNGLIPWSAGRAGTPVTGETRVVWLIPEFAGSNPAPLLGSAAQGLLPMGEGPWCNRVCDQSRGPSSRLRLEKSPTSETGWHGSRQRGTRDTLPLAISGRLSRK
jgi:hypothetical protein